MAKYVFKERYLVTKRDNYENVLSSHFEYRDVELIVLEDEIIASLKTPQEKIKAFWTVFKSLRKGEKCINRFGEITEENAAVYNGLQNTCEKLSSQCRYLYQFVKPYIKDEVESAMRDGA